MGYISTNSAGPSSRRGIVWFGRAVFAVAALAVTSAFAVWISDFDPADGIQNPQPKSEAPGPSRSMIALDRARCAIRGSINYPSRPILRSLRSTFAAEFGHIESQLAGQLREGQTDQPERTTTSAEGAIPLPRSRPVEANLQARNDPPPVQADNRTLFQKLADLVPPAKFTLASLTPGDGLFGSEKDLARSATTISPPSTTSRRARFICRTVRSSRRIQAWGPDGRSGHVEQAKGRRDAAEHLRSEAAGEAVPRRCGAAHDAGRRERHARPTGLLVHSYMLGPNGDSNGCVSIKEYDKFLAAYRTARSSASSLCRTSTRG